MLIFTAFLISQEARIISSVVLLILGFRLIYSTDYDGWLEELRN